MNQTSSKFSLFIFKLSVNCHGQILKCSSTTMKEPRQLSIFLAMVVSLCGGFLYCLL